MIGDACVTQGSVECVMHSSASAGVGAEQKYIVCILYVHALHSQMVLEPTCSKARKKVWVAIVRWVAIFRLLGSQPDISTQCKTDLSFRSQKTAKISWLEASKLRCSSVQVQAEPEKIAATPEEMPASASASSKVPNLTADPEIKAELEEIEGILTQKSDAKFGEEEEKVEIEKTKTKESELNPRPTGWKDGSVLFCDSCWVTLIAKIEWRIFEN